MAGFWLVPPRVQLIEPVTAPEFFIENVGGHWYDNGLITTHLYRTEVTVEEPMGPPSNLVSLKVRWPHLHLEEIIDALKRCRYVHAPSTQPADPPPPSGNRPQLVR